MLPPSLLAGGLVVVVGVCVVGVWVVGVCVVGVCVVGVSVVGAVVVPVDVVGSAVFSGLGFGHLQLRQAPLAGAAGLDGGAGDLDRVRRGGLLLRLDGRGAVAGGAS